MSAIYYMKCSIHLYRWTSQFISPTRTRLVPVELLNNYFWVNRHSLMTRCCQMLLYLMESLVLKRLDLVGNGRKLGECRLAVSYSCAVNTDRARGLSLAVSWAEGNACC